MQDQIKEYLEKYKITSKEQLEKHIEELVRNTTVDRDLVFMLALALDDKELLSNLFLRKNKTEIEKRTELANYYKDLAIKNSNLETPLLKTVRLYNTNGQLKEDKKEPHSTVESNSKEALREIYGDLANITKNDRGLYQVNFAKKENKTQETVNRLIEEELEKQEQQVLKNWNTTSTLKQEPITFHLDSPSKENLNKMSDNFLERVKNDSDKCGVFGKKETKGKLDYELDWKFIQQMAERMSQNKGKYEPYNWKKPMDVEKLKQSLFRHVIEIMKGNYSDDGRGYGHLESLADNAMMINYQLKNNKN